MNINDILIFEKGDPLSCRFAQGAKNPGEMDEMLSRKLYLCARNGIHPGTTVRVYEDGKAVVEP